MRWLIISEQSYLLHKYDNVVDLDAGHGAESTGKETKQKMFRRMMNAAVDLRVRTEKKSEFIGFIIYILNWRGTNSTPQSVDNCINKNWLNWGVEKMWALGRI